MPLGTLNNQTVATCGRNTIPTTLISARILTTSNRLFRYTPPTCFAPTNIAISNVLINTATVSFTAPIPTVGSGFNYEVRSSGLPGSGASGLEASGTVVSPQIIPSLPSGTQLFLYLQSNCPPASGWSAPISFKTECDAQNVLYSQFFDSLSGTNLDDALVPSVPYCNRSENLGLGNSWATADANFAPHDASFMFDNVLMYNGETGPGATNSANSWFYTRGVNMLASKTYFITYSYGGSATTINKMKVAYGTQPQAASTPHEPG